MNQRDLSLKLEELAIKLEEWGNDDEISEGVVFWVAEELRKLSKENYAPGNGQSWSDIAPKSTKKVYTDKKTGKKSPF